MSVANNEETFITGHRKRLRQRFISSGPPALLDYEVLELLLTYSIPRKDVKPVAKKLLKKFSSLNGLLKQDVSRLCEIKGIGINSAMLIVLVREIMARCLASSVKEGRKLSSPEEAVNYVKVALGMEAREAVYLICLNSANKVVHRSIISKGTVNQAPVYPREIAKVALIHGATAVILVHNHPGGQCSPSNDDIELTTRIKDALSKLDIRLHDHLIVTAEQVYSIAAGRIIK